MVDDRDSAMARTIPRRFDGLPGLTDPDREIPRCDRRARALRRCPLVRDHDEPADLARLLGSARLEDVDLPPPKRMRCHDATQREIHLGLFLQGAGHHVSGWRHPRAEAGSENFDLLRRVAQMAEAAKFDMVFLADGLTSGADAHPSTIARFEPLTLLAALAMVTEPDRPRGDLLDHLRRAVSHRPGAFARSIT